MLTMQRTIVGLGAYSFFDLLGKVPNQVSYTPWTIQQISSAILYNIAAPWFKGLANQMQIAPPNATQNPQNFTVEADIDAKIVGQWASRAFLNFFNGTGYEAGSFGTLAGNTLAKEVKNFTDRVKLDPATAGKVASRIIRDATAHLEVEEIVEQIKEKIIAGIDALDLAEVTKQLTDIIGKASAEGVRNIAGRILNVATFELLPIALLGLAAVISTPLATYWMYRRALHKIGTPKLATEVHQHTILTPLTNRVKSAAAVLTGSRSKEKKEKKPVFSPRVTRRVDELLAATRNIRKNGGYFQHALFYGPGGTGKTLLGEYIAKNSGMSWIKMSGGDLAQYIKRGEHVTELNRLFDKISLPWRPWSTEPWILYIDEAESLCRDRSTIPTAELLELQNALLNRTGTESKRFMIILSTNQVGYMDEAVLTRIDHKLYIGLPAAPERVRILQSHIPEFFSRSEQAKFFKVPQVQKIANATSGFSGRMLFKLLNTISNKKAIAADHTLTQAMIDQAVVDLVASEKEIEKRRTLKGAPRIPMPAFKKPVPTLSKIPVR